MIRSTVVPRPVRVGAALVGVTGMLAFAGCATTDGAAGASDGSDTSTDTSADISNDSGTNDSSSGSGSSNGSAGATGSFRDGTYTAEGSYATPESIEKVTVTVTLDGDVITAVEVVGDPQKSESREYQGQFIGGISDAVVGQRIDEIAVSRVAGSSLTSGGFNRAIEEIKAEAAA